MITKSGIIIPDNSNNIEAPAVQNYLNRSVELQSKDIMRLWRAKPVIFIQDAFDVTPDDWQEEVFELYTHNQRLGLIASKGVGKSWTLAMLGWHFFMTKYQPKIAAISVTKDHLKANLWAELLMWRERSELCKLSTNEGAERITMKGHEGYSFMDARSYPKSADQNTQASALAGFHADNIAFLIDEAGTIPDAVLATADAALTTAPSSRTDSKILLTANPEVPSGLLYRASIGKTEQKWAIHRISGDPDDPKRAPRVDINWAREQIKTYGRDYPWVLINVMGQYPATSSDMLLTDSEVQAAMDRTIDDKDVFNSQTRLGVDVARGGVDMSALARRRGLQAYKILEESSMVTGPGLAGIIMKQQEDHQIERVFVDNTGGFGSSVVDSLDMAAATMDVTPIHFNEKAQDKRYFNKRTEMWVRMRDWVRKGGCLPKDPKLMIDLTAPKILFHGGSMRLEEKEHIKSRIGRSVDNGDALALTFADVEQPSFFADYSSHPSSAGQSTIDKWKSFQGANAQQNNHVSDPDMVDSNHNPFYPKHSS